MKISIKTKQIEMTDALKEFTESKIAGLKKLLTNFEKEGEKTIFVELARSTKHHHKGKVFMAELMLDISKKIIRIEQYDEDIRTAIDIAKDKMRFEINKEKEKIGKIKRREK